ncbi:MAG TPA: FAD-dependent oxidoreductase, partial [Deltaproteobacteria bacterium]|nr:FAD-dependent oxidoreductase [Deltaproteobacteria bacterium]
MRSGGATPYPPPAEPAPLSSNPSDEEISPGSYARGISASGRTGEPARSFGGSSMMHAGRKVIEIDRVRRVVRAEDGTEAAYDRLLLATGSTPFILPVPGRDLPGVVAYRDIADTEAMIDAAGRYRHAVVIGAGLLALDEA